MFHAAAKVLFFLLQPSTLAVLGLGVGTCLASRPIGRKIILGALSWLVLIGFLPFGSLLILPLEDRFATREPAVPNGSVAGIIILGGFESGWITTERGGLAVNEAAERLTEGVRLARLLPDSKIIFSGGAGGLFQDVDAGAAVRRYFTDLGFAANRLVIENASRDTYENALFTRDLLKPAAQDRWLLVTSAYHMPRAIGVFRKVGFLVTPFPVDFRTRGGRDLMRPFVSIEDGLQLTDLAAKEWIGLLAYWIDGRTSALFPGP